ncbi:MAG: hypothetical protein WCR33_01165 [Bacilli bacterium]
MEEKHTCYLCGSEANYQLKSGKWCCTANARSCIVVREKVSRAAKEKWESLKNKGIRKRKDIPEEQQRNADKGKEGVCFYCGQEGNYLLKNGRWCCSKNYQSCQEIRNKNSSSCKNNCTTKESNFASWNEKRKRVEVSSWNKGLTQETSEKIRIAGEKVKERYKNGSLVSKFKGTKHSKEHRELLSKIQSERLANSNVGGFRKIGWYKVENLNGTLYTVRGTWERDVANELNRLGLLWIKNVYLFYVKPDGVKHRYNPDFFLPNENLYIEVKGYYSEDDKLKMKLVLEQNNVNIRLFEKDQIKLIRNSMMTTNEILEN